MYNSYYNPDVNIWICQKGCILHSVRKKQQQQKTTTTRMNEWMNEWIKWMNEWMNEWMIEWTLLIIEWTY